MSKKCDECEKIFDSEEALEQHVKDKHRKHDVKPHGKSKKKYYLLAAAVIIIIAVIVFVFGSSQVKYNIKTLDEDYYLGNRSAAVTVTEFSDFQCPYCANFHKQTFGQIKGEYIDTEKTKFIYKHFPLPLHSNSRKAAEAADGLASLFG